MNAKKFFEAMNNDSLLEWIYQYGEGRQAAYYRTAPRRAAWAEMAKRGLTPIPLRRTPRPRGYAGRPDSHNGWLKNQGLMV